MPPTRAGVKRRFAEPRLQSPESILAVVEETPQAASVLARFGQIATNGTATAR